MKPYHLKVGTSFSAWINLEDILVIHDVIVNSIEKTGCCMLYSEPEHLHADAEFLVEFRFKDSLTRVIVVQSQELTSTVEEYKLVSEFNKEFSDKMAELKLAHATLLEAWKNI